MRSMSNIPKSTAIFSVLRAIPGLGILLLLLSCHGGSGPPPGETDPRFRTTPPSRLYFLNMRSSAYTQLREPGSGLDLYRLRQWSAIKPQPPLIPLIADNWLQDEAYLRLWLDKAVFPDDTVRVAWASPSDTGQYVSTGRSPAAQLALARQLANALRAGHRLNVVGRGEGSQALLDSPTESKLFLQTLSDYLSLIEADRK